MNESLVLMNSCKFGLFIHWGPYSQLAGEWKGRSSLRWAEWIQFSAKIAGAEYAEQARTFYPSKYNANDWVKIAQDAGMKYLVYTTKHHDGFCMFRTKHTRYNIVDHTSFGRDPLEELANACAKNSMRLGLYYSILDWHHPEFPPMYSPEGYHGFPNPHADIGKYADYQNAQVKELLGNYGPIFVMWFDGGGSFQGVDRNALLKGKDMIHTIRSLQPDCLINNRFGDGVGDYGTPEGTIPGEIQSKPFEVCMTIQANWGHSKFDKEFKQGKALTRMLVDIAHKGGNLLLNAGPTGEGEIIDDYRRPLQEMGQWLAVNGEAIYGTRNNVLPKLLFEGRSTTRILDNDTTRLYLHVFAWPVDGVLKVSGLRNAPIRAFLLSEGPASRLPLSKLETTVDITMPERAIHAVAWVVVLDIEGKPELEDGAQPEKERV